MDLFTYRDAELYAENVNLSTLAAHVGTPTYVYSANTLRLHYRRLTEAFAPLNPLICFSVKSCPNLSILKTLAELGSGMDVVSGGELARARLAGVHSFKIVYAGVGKSDEEIVDALGKGSTPHDPIYAFNIESEQEFQNIAAIAAALKVRCRAALRINPDVDAQTHKFTTTGKKENKFGVPLPRAREFFKHYAGHPYLHLSGVHLHLGSPIYSPQPYVDAIKLTLELIKQIEADDPTHRIDLIDIGGGFGADYRTGQTLAIKEYADQIVPLLLDRALSQGRHTGKPPTRIVLEPGRFIAANAGVLLTRVQYVKETATKKFLICDAGMHTLIRPALYEAFHFVWPTCCAPDHVPTSRAEKIDIPGLETCDVVGPICESSDFLALDRPLPPIARGDLLTVFTAGAYGVSMSSRYNSHTLPAEVLVDGSQARVIRRRESFADLISHELNPAPVQTARS